MEKRFERVLQETLQVNLDELHEELKGLRASSRQVRCAQSSWGSCLSQLFSSLDPPGPRSFTRENPRVHLGRLRGLRIRRQSRHTGVRGLGSVSVQRCEARHGSPSEVPVVDATSAGTSRDLGSLIGSTLALPPPLRDELSKRLRDRVATTDGGLNFEGGWGQSWEPPSWATMLVLLAGIFVLHIIGIILLLAWWMTDTISTDVWARWIKTNGIWNYTDLPSGHPYPQEYLQAVQASSVLACIFSIIAILVFVAQLFTLAKGKRFTLSGLFQLLACLSIMIAAAIYTDQFHKNEQNGWYGHCFILAWI
ncbi:hypothetical protein CRUP_005554, partial [Coryphaenoides rupestris]